MHTLYTRKPQRIACHPCILSRLWGHSPEELHSAIEIGKITMKSNLSQHDSEEIVYRRSTVLSVNEFCNQRGTR